MKCHYEVLDVPRDANSEELKKAYRKAALKWHPDKNLSNPDLAKEQFQLVQQAYEVLNDSHERAWYDAHRDAILKGGLGGDYKDDSLDVFPYFSTSCFKGFGDDDGGYYSVYREVFNKIAAEDSEYMEDGDSDFEIPSFGNSTSDFKEVVQPFYAHWQDYATKKSFSWLDQYDIKDLPNRRIAKLVERENKKIRDKARKERNEQIRNLVAFVRKRDKRVQAQAEIVKEQQAEKARLAEERRKEKLRERQKQAKEYQESEWSKLSNIENELKNIEKSLQAEYGDHGSSADHTEGEDEMEEEVEDYDSLYCPACKKLFKSDKAFVNHENSKKHKDNVEILRQTLLEEDEQHEHIEDLDDEEIDEEELGEETGDEQDSEDVANEEGEEDDEKPEAELDISEDGAAKIKKKIEGSDEESEEVKLENESDDSDSPQVSLKSKKTKRQNKVFSDLRDHSDEDSVEEFSMMSKKQRRKLQQQRVATSISDSDNENEAEPESIIDVDVESTSEKQDSVPKPKLKGKKAKEARKLQRQAESEATSNTKEGVVNLGKPSSNNVQSNKSQSKKGNKNEPVDISVIDTEHVCATCTSNFSSKNKLFEHLKKTNHSIYIPKGNLEVKDEKKKNKGRRK